MIASLSQAILKLYITTKKMAIVFKELPFPNHDFGSLWVSMSYMSRVVDLCKICPRLMRASQWSMSIVPSWTSCAWCLHDEWNRNRCIYIYVYIYIYKEIYQKCHNNKTWRFAILQYWRIATEMLEVHIFLEIYIIITGHISRSNPVLGVSY